MYPLTVYCGYRWFYYFCLLTSLLVFVDDFLPLLYVCSLFISELFHFIIFLFLVAAFSFLLRELPFSSVQLLSRVWLFATPHQASLSITNSRSSLGLASIGPFIPHKIFSSLHLPLNDNSWDSSGRCPGLISDQETRSHVLQLRVRMSQLKILQQRSKIPRAATKIWHRQINKW